MQTPERIKLSEAIAAHREAQDDVERAESLLAGANRKLTELLSAHAAFDTLDDEIRDARAAMTVRAIEHGDSPIPTHEPEGFASRLTARDHAESELASVRSAIPVLESQLASAKHRAEQRRYEIDLAAEAVFIREAKQMASRYVEMLREARETLYVLRFMGARQVQRDPSQRRTSTGLTHWGNEATRLIAMPQSVLQACQSDCLGDSEYKEGLRKRDMVSAAVSALWGALHSDPNAKLEIAELPPGNAKVVKKLRVENESKSPLTARGIGRPRAMGGNASRKSLWIGD